MEQMLKLRPQPGSDGHSSERRYINENPAWRPRLARGIYGGVLISQSLAAGLISVPSCWLPRSMKCSFLKAGNSAALISYHARGLGVKECQKVAIIRVDASQNGEIIFMATIQFSDCNDATSPLSTVQQRLQFKSEPPTVENLIDDDPSRPYLIHEIVTPSSKFVWLRTREIISSNDKHVHLAALAFLSDSFFITTVAQVLGLRMQHRTARTGESSNDPSAPVVKMMVSLDHVIYFHDWEFRADDWICAEMEVHWSGDGRALVRGRIYDRAEKLVATCVQEGVVRIEAGKAMI